jgi:BirA family biotin operon repressor/biotin-[acetyl-CoA-carboxylase] ligase
MAANALFESLALYIDRECLALKWPNDVLLNGGKVAGILLESASSSGPLVDWLSIGVGVNLAKAPHDTRTEFPPVCLRGEGGEEVTPEEFLRVLAGHFATQEGKLAAMGFPRIREDWLEKAARLGEIVTARTSTREITGIFETVDQAGNLILRVEGREVMIPAAEVYF